MIFRGPLRAVLPAVALLVCAAPPAHGQSSNTGSATKPKRLNAHMTVTYYTYGKYRKSWSRPVAWTGRLNQYQGYVVGQKIQWIGEPPNPHSIRLMTTRTGQGGKLLRVATPKGTTGITVVVTSLASAHGRSKTPSAHAPSTTKPKKPRPPRRFKPERSLRRQSAPPLPTMRPRREKRSSATATRLRRPRPERRSATVGDAPSIKNKKRSSKPASIGDGRDRRKRARTQRVGGTGVLKGQDGGEARGRAGGQTAQRGGIGSPNASPRGKGKTRHGMKGGTGANGALGVPSGWGLIPLINVPASLRHATDILLSMKDANPGQLASRYMQRIAARTTAYRVRKGIAKDASKYASKRMSAFTDEIQRATAKMTEKQRAKAINRWQWEIQRQYFARVEQGAAARLAKGGLSAVDERKAKMVLEATKVKPVAGQLPRNHRFAGKEFPRNQLPPAYRQTGVRFTEDGFPDFGPYAKQLPNGQMSVQITLTGSYAKDTTRARIAAGFKSARDVPGDHVWHHAQDGRTMILVPFDLHDKVRHSGGRGIYRHVTGDANAY